MKTQDDLHSIVKAEWFDEFFWKVYEKKRIDDEKQLMAARCGKKPRNSSIQYLFELMMRDIKTELRKDLENHIHELEKEKRNDES